MALLRAAVVDTTKIRFEVQHVLGVLGGAFAGAFIAYLLAVPHDTLIGAITHWDSLKPMLETAAAVGVVAALVQAQKSYFKSAAALLLVGFVSIAAACTPAQQQAVAPVADDFMQVAGCVEKEILQDGVTNVPAIIVACGPQEGALVLAVVDAFFKSKKAATLPAPKLEQLRASYAAALPSS